MGNSPIVVNLSPVGTGTVRLTGSIGQGSGTIETETVGRIETERLEVQRATEVAETLQQMRKRQRKQQKRFKNSQNSQNDGSRKINLRIVYSNDECSICFNPNGNKYVTKCGHIYHRECLQIWFKQYKKDCPVCRKNL